MDTLVFGTAAVGAAALLTVVLMAVLRVTGLVVDTARLVHMEKVSEALTKGIALLTALLGILATREGGIGRLVANAGDEFTAAILCVVGSVLLAFLAWMIVAAAPDRTVTWLWLLATLSSVALFGTSVRGVLRAQEVASEKLDRPSLSVESTAQGLKFTANIDLMTATDFMRTTVYGYPAGDNERQLLFNSTSGPDAKGRASLTGTVTQALTGYEVVEVRAFRGLEDPGCEKPLTEGVQDNGPAACASIWITPKVGT